MLLNQFNLVKKELDSKIVLTLAGIFFIFMLVFSLHRFYTFYATFDQGLFTQLFWNTIHGNWFQGSLSSGQSSAYLQDHQVEKVFYCHLGQHFVIDFLLWMPLYALFPSGTTLVILQVVLMTAAGIVLYALSRHYLPPLILILITASFYGGNAVIGPTFANFYEHCQIPLFVFSLLLALVKHKWSIFWLFVILILGVREEAGVIVFGIGLNLIFSRKYLRLGIALCLISFSYVTLVTNVIMPLFSNDNSRLYLSTYFSKFVPDIKNPSTLQLLWGILTHPKELFETLFTRSIDKPIKYLLGQWLPLAFVPAISPAAWITAEPPLLIVLLQNNQIALGMSVRFALTVVPGLFYGTIIWWSEHQERFTSKFKRWWIRGIILSLVIAILSSPNRAFYFLVPDSINPWVHIGLTRQWEHVGYIRKLIQLIPPDASVSTTNYIIPHLATRRGIIRLPSVDLQMDSREVMDVDFALADLWQLQQYQAAFKGERKQLLDFIALIDKFLAEGKYGLVDIKDGVVLLQKKVKSPPEVMTNWLKWRSDALITSPK